MTDATVIVLLMVLIPLLIICVTVMALRLRAAIKRDRTDESKS
jgi:hypothetical protein